MFGLIATVAGLALIAKLAHEHIEYGGKITIGGLIFLMILAVGWSAKVDQMVACDAGSQSACEAIDADDEARDNQPGM